MPAKKKAPELSRLTVMMLRKETLAQIKASLESLQEAHISHEEAFLQAVLPTRLKMGLHCLKAHALFALEDPAKRGQGRKTKTITSTVDVISPQGFEGWLATEIPWLKKPTAYRWMTAVKGLRLDEKAAEADVEPALQALRDTHAEALLAPVSLKSLCDAATENIGPPVPPPPAPEQQEFNFLRDELSRYREFTDTLLNLKSQLEANPDFHRAASSRAYHVLHELTGKHWKPSDEADELADIDPDTITV